MLFLFSILGSILGFNKTKVESVQLGKILDFSVSPPLPRTRVKYWGWDGELERGGGLLLRLGLVYIPNLSLLLSLEPLEKFLCGGWWWWVVVVGGV